MLACTDRHLNVDKCRATSGDLNVCMCAGSAAAFQVLADADLWPEAVHLAAACLAGSCEQPAQLLVCLHSTMISLPST